MLLMNTTGKTGFQHIFLVLVSILTALLIFELFVRLSGLWIKDTYDKRTYFSESNLPGVPYTLKPGIHAVWARTDIITNSDGIRDRREFMKKDKNAFRILCIGDSITFGLGVDQDETYPEQMEHLLNKYKKNNKVYEVINAGISGFNAVDETNLLGYLNTKYNPDLILWLIVENDFDDSLSVNDKGQLICSRPDYGASNEFLMHVWGLEGKYIYADNFLLSMREHERYRALGKRYVEKESWFGIIKSFLSHKLYSYCFVASRLKGAADCDTRVFVPEENGFIRKIPVISEDNVTDFLPEFSGIFLSSYYSSRFETAISRGIEFAKVGNTPLMLLTFNMLIEHEGIAAAENIYFQEITEYLGMPVHRFAFLYNLGWDGHLNKKGNNLLAKAVMHCLADEKLVDVDNPRKQKLYNKKYFWERYKLERDAYINSLEPTIDFRHFRNIHQIIGGIYPSCVFPIKGNAKLSLILGKDDENIFNITGANNGNPQDIGIWISDGKVIIEEIFTIPAGSFDLGFETPEILDGEVIDIQIRCASDVCGKIKLHYIGFGKDDI